LRGFTAYVTAILRVRFTNLFTYTTHELRLRCVTEKIMLIYFLLCEYMLASSSGYNDRLITHLQVQAVNVKYLKLVFLSRDAI